MTNLLRHLAARHAAFLFASALVLGVRQADARSWLREALSRDEAAICDQVALEVLMGARNADDFQRLEESLRAMRWLRVEPADWDAALAVQRALAEHGPGHQRSVRIPDLLIAAVGARHVVPVVHYDEGYDRIAAITGQPTRWILPRGSV